MDADAIITILTGVAGVTGGFFGGKRLGSSQAQTVAVDTVGLLQIAVAELRTQAEEKDREIATLMGRVSSLEGIVTQRAEVEAVHVDVLENQQLLHRIADKVGA
jgi:FtsZ-binding cell division protein ZapB